MGKFSEGKEQAQEGLFNEADPQTETTTEEQDKISESSFFFGGQVPNQEQKGLDDLDGLNHQSDGRNYDSYYSTEDLSNSEYTKYDDPSFWKGNKAMQALVRANTETQKERFVYDITDPEHPLHNNNSPDPMGSIVATNISESRRLIEWKYDPELREGSVELLELALGTTDLSPKERKERVDELTAEMTIEEAVQRREDFERLFAKVNEATDKISESLNRQNAATIEQDLKEIYRWVNPMKDAELRIIKKLFLQKNGVEFDEMLDSLERLLDQDKIFDDDQKESIKKFIEHIRERADNGYNLETRVRELKKTLAEHRKAKPESFGDQTLDNLSNLGGHLGDIFLLGALNKGSFLQANSKDRMLAAYTELNLLIAGLTPEQLKDITDKMRETTLDVGLVHVRNEFDDKGDLEDLASHFRKEYEEKPHSYEDDRSYRLTKELELDKVEATTDEKVDKAAKVLADTLAKAYAVTNGIEGLSELEVATLKKHLKGAFLDEKGEPRISKWQELISATNDYLSKSTNPKVNSQSYKTAHELLFKEEQNFLAPEGSQHGSSKASLALNEDEKIAERLIEVLTKDTISEAKALEDLETELSYLSPEQIENVLAAVERLRVRQETKTVWQKIDPDDTLQQNVITPPPDNVPLTYTQLCAQTFSDPIMQAQAINEISQGFNPERQAQDVVFKIGADLHSLLSKEEQTFFGDRKFGDEKEITDEEQEIIERVFTDLVQDKASNMTQAQFNAFVDELDILLHANLDVISEVLYGDYSDIQLKFRGVRYKWDDKNAQFGTENAGSIMNSMDDFVRAVHSDAHVIGPDEEAVRANIRAVVQNLDGSKLQVIAGLIKSYHGNQVFTDLENVMMYHGFHNIVRAMELGVNPWNDANMSPEDYLNHAELEQTAINIGVKLSDIKNAAHALFQLRQQGREADMAKVLRRDFANADGQFQAEKIQLLVKVQEQMHPQTASWYGAIQLRNELRTNPPNFEAINDIEASLGTYGSPEYKMNLAHQRKSYDALFTAPEDQQAWRDYRKQAVSNLANEESFSVWTAAQAIKQEMGVHPPNFTSLCNRYGSHFESPLQRELLREAFELRFNNTSAYDQLFVDYVDNKAIKMGMPDALDIAKELARPILSPAKIEALVNKIGKRTDPDFHEKINLLQQIHEAHNLAGPNLLALAEQAQTFVNEYAYDDLARLLDVSNFTRNSVQENLIVLSKMLYPNQKRDWGEGLRLHRYLEANLDHQVLSSILNAAHPNNATSPNWDAARALVETYQVMYNSDEKLKAFVEKYAVEKAINLNFDYLNPHLLRIEQATTKEDLYHSIINKKVLEVDKPDFRDKLDLLKIRYLAAASNEADLTKRNETWAEFEKHIVEEELKSNQHIQILPNGRTQTSTLSLEKCKELAESFQKDMTQGTDNFLQHIKNNPHHNTADTYKILEKVFRETYPNQLNPFALSRRAHELQGQGQAEQAAKLVAAHLNLGEQQDNKAVNSFLGFYDFRFKHENQPAWRSTIELNIAICSPAYSQSVVDGIVGSLGNPSSFEYQVNLLNLKEAHKVIYPNSPEWSQFIRKIYEAKSQALGFSDIGIDLMEIDEKRPHLHEGSTDLENFLKSRLGYDPNNPNDPSYYEKVKHLIEVSALGNPDLSTYIQNAMIWQLDREAQTLNFELDMWDIIHGIHDNLTEGKGNLHDLMVDFGNGNPQDQAAIFRLATKAYTFCYPNEVNPFEAVKALVNHQANVSTKPKISELLQAIDSSNISRTSLLELSGYTTKLKEDRYETLHRMHSLLGEGKIAEAIEVFDKHLGIVLPKDIAASIDELGLEFAQIYKGSDNAELWRSFKNAYIEKEAKSLFIIDINKLAFDLYAELRQSNSTQIPALLSKLGQTGKPGFEEKCDVIGVLCSNGVSNINPIETCKLFKEYSATNNYTEMVNTVSELKSKGLDINSMAALYSTLDPTAQTHWATGYNLETALTNSEHQEVVNHLLENAYPNGVHFLNQANLDNAIRVHAGMYPSSQLSNFYQNYSIDEALAYKLNSFEVAAALRDTLATEPDKINEVMKKYVPLNDPDYSEKIDIIKRAFIRSGVPADKAQWQEIMKAQITSFSFESIPDEEKDKKWAELEKINDGILNGNNAELIKIYNDNPNSLTEVQLALEHAWNYHHPSEVNPFEMARRANELSISGDDLAAAVLVRNTYLMKATPIKGWRAFLASSELRSQNEPQLWQTAQVVHQELNRSTPNWSRVERKLEDLGKPYSLEYRINFNKFTEICKALAPNGNWDKLEQHEMERAAQRFGITDLTQLVDEFKNLNTNPSSASLMDIIDPFLAKHQLELSDRNFNERVVLVEKALDKEDPRLKNTLQIALEGRVYTEGESLDYQDQCYKMTIDVQNAIAAQDQNALVTALEPLEDRNDPNYNTKLELLEKEFTIIFPEQVNPFEAINQIADYYYNASYDRIPEVIEAISQSPTGLEAFSTIWAKIDPQLYNKLEPAIQLEILIKNEQEVEAISFLVKECSSLDAAALESYAKELLQTHSQLFRDSHRIKTFTSRSDVLEAVAAGFVPHRHFRRLNEVFCETKAENKIDLEKIETVVYEAIGSRDLSQPENAEKTLALLKTYTDKFDEHKSVLEDIHKEYRRKEFDRKAEDLDFDVWAAAKAFKEGDLLQAQLLIGYPNRVQAMDKLDLLAQAYDFEYDLKDQQYIKDIFDLSQKLRFTKGASIDSIIDSSQFLVASAYNSDRSRFIELYNNCHPQRAEALYRDLIDAAYIHGASKHEVLKDLALLTLEDRARIVVNILVEIEQKAKTGEDFDQRGNEYCSIRAAFKGLNRRESQKLVSDINEQLKTIPFTKNGETVKKDYNEIVHDRFSDSLSKTFDLQRLPYRFAFEDEAVKVINSLNKHAEIETLESVLLDLNSNPNKDEIIDTIDRLLATMARDPNFAKEAGIVGSNSIKGKDFEFLVKRARNNEVKKAQRLAYIESRITDLKLDQGENLDAIVLVDMMEFFESLASKTNAEIKTALVNKYPDLDISTIPANQRFLLEVSSVVEIAIEEERCKDADYLSSAERKEQLSQIEDNLTDLKMARGEDLDLDAVVEMNEFIKSLESKTTAEVKTALEAKYPDLKIVDIPADDKFLSKVGGVIEQATKDEEAQDLDFLANHTSRQQLSYIEGKITDLKFQRGENLSASVITDMIEFFESLEGETNAKVKSALEAKYPDLNISNIPAGYRFLLELGKQIDQTIKEEKQQAAASTGTGATVRLDSPAMRLDALLAQGEKDQALELVRQTVGDNSNNELAQLKKDYLLATDLKKTGDLEKLLEENEINNRFNRKLKNVA